MSKVWVLIALIIIVGGGVYFMMMGNKTSSPDKTQPLTTTVQTPAPTAVAVAEGTTILNEQNESREYGTAVLTEEGGKVKVTLNMQGYPGDMPQPAHIHAGTCPDVGAVVYPLTSVVNGKSVTTLNVTLAQLAAKQPLGINVHKSVPETKLYVSCGDLKLPMSAPAASTSTAPATVPAPASNPGY